MNKPADTRRPPPRRPGVWAALALAAAGAALVALELAIGREGRIPQEGLMLFPAVFGFLGFLVVVLAGAVARVLLGRGEGYYDRD